MSAIWKVVLKLAPLWWAIGLAFGVQLLEFKGWLASPEGILLDFFLADAPFVPSSRPPAPIVTLEIDDIAYDDPDRGCFFYSPMDPRGIGPLIEAALNAGAAVVGVDIITDSPQKDDRHRYEDLAQESRGKPIVWAAGAESPSLNRPELLWDWLRGEWLSGPEPIEVLPTAVLGQKNRNPKDKLLPWGLPIYPREQDLHLRRFSRNSIVAPSIRTLNWASKIAELYCKRPGNCPQGELTHEDKELYVSFAGLSGVRRYLMSDLFECNAQARHDINVLPKEPGKFKDFNEFAHNAIVLIGGTFPSSRDFYSTPEGPETPGLLINARVIQAEIAGNGVSEIPGVARFLLDVLLGLLIAFVFMVTPSRSLKPWIFITWICILAAVCISAIVLLWLRHPWLSVVYLILGLFIASLIKSSSLNLRLLLSLGWILGAVVISATVLYARRYIWLSCVAIAVGMVVHVLREIWKEHLQLGDGETVEIPMYEELDLEISEGRVPPPEE